MYSKKKNPAEVKKLTKRAVMVFSENNSPLCICSYSEQAEHITFIIEEFAKIS